jgi:uncharacterized membrane-anchored protein
MHRFSWRTGLLAATFLVQLALLISMIAGAERTIDKGRIWKFQTAPVDPVDLFRGRYAALSFPIVWVPVVEGEVEQGDLVYALLETDEEGFARFSGVSASPPSSPDHLELVALGASRGRARVQLPYDRFYMDEERAPEVDRLMRGRLGPAWVRVRIYEGKGVVVDLHVAEALELEELTASSLTVWPEGTPVPVSLLERFREALGDWQVANCQREQTCVLAAIDLDDTVEGEFLLTTGQPLGGGRIFYASRLGEAEGAKEWTLRPMQYTGGRLPRSPEEIIQALEATGTRGEAPPRRWLRLGDALLYAPI